MGAFVMRSFVAGFVLWICLAQASPAQSPPRVSFAGTIVGVERVDEPALPRVRIVVRLTAPAIAAGQVASFEEWDGLWTNRGRYRVGQSVALTLYPTSALGLTSATPPAKPLAAPRDPKRVSGREILPRPDRRRAPRVE